MSKLFSTRTFLLSPTREGQEEPKSSHFFLISHVPLGSNSLPASQIRNLKNDKTGLENRLGFHPHLSFRLQTLPGCHSNAGPHTSILRDTVSWCCARHRHSARQRALAHPNRIASGARNPPCEPSSQGHVSHSHGPGAQSPLLCKCFSHPSQVTNHAHFAHLCSWWPLISYSFPVIF